MKLDETDAQILTLLQRDARLSMRAIAKQVHLSAPSVAERVKKLEEAGIISGYTVRIDRKKLGFLVDCLIEVTLRNGEIHRFKDFVQTCPNVVFCYCVAGRACYIMMVAAPSLAAIEDLINGMAPYAETVTNVIFSEVPTKSDLIWHSPRMTD
ncbi:Lrp/AsnC family transcriptional regulator [Sporolactobacillus sp. THM7-7]|nr:Lrp/AsnC family transcriptional regulator [Sporolactobacillus sp. THM7-7]